MKKLSLAALISITTITATPVFADDEFRNGAQRFTTLSATTVAGALAGGPVGLLVGFLGGAYLSDQSKKDFQQQQHMSNELLELEKEVHDKSFEIIDLQERVAQTLEFQVMFATGDDQLAVLEQSRIRSLAEYLKKNPDLNVRLDGHADPRGTDEYNNVLSRERALSVAESLIEQGISKTRISIHAHGASLATFTSGSHDELAFERRVHIAVFTPDEQKMASTQ